LLPTLHFSHHIIPGLITITEAIICYLIQVLYLGQRIMLIKS